MAVARLSCGACGASLPVGAASCPGCGEPVQFPAGMTQSGDQETRAGTCPVCGHRNQRSGAFCESCGSTLAPGRAAHSPQEPRPHMNRAGGWTRERWKIALVVVVVLIVALFGYLELNRPAPPAPQVQNTPPMEPPMEQVRRLQEAVRANPGDPDALLRLANQLHDMGLSAPSLLNGAIDAYTRYLQLKPTDPNARVDLGICYFELGRTDSTQSLKLFRSAVREMKTALTSAPKHQPAAFNLGVVSLFMGETDEATRWFRKTIDLGPETELGRRAKNMLEQHALPSAAP
jgi:cytochrome c-type biogenesis protein CcmH/NrfG